MDCAGFFFTLINDYQGRNIPLTEFRVTGISVEAKDWSGDVSYELIVLILMSV